MSIIRPFRAILPNPDLAERIAALPYDVMNRQEAKIMVKHNPYSFLHISRAEIDLPSAISDHDPVVYQKARANLDGFLEKGYLRQEVDKLLYIYRLTMNERQQTGLVACTSVDEYLNGRIKKHEFTRPVKEQDRIDHFDACDCHTEGVFMTYRRDEDIAAILGQWADQHEPMVDFIAADQVVHQLWEIDDPLVIRDLVGRFEAIDSLYIADGHHRSASAAKVCQLRRRQHPGYTGDECFNYFLSVLFPHDELLIMDYNRVIKGYNGLTPDEFLIALGMDFTVEKMPGPYYPERRHTFGVFVDSRWYKVTAKPHICPDDILRSMDANILQDNVIGPILGIHDPRSDQRIDFVGGIRGLRALEKRCTQDMDIAIVVYPTSIEEVITIADSGQVLPAKSTWFEPKLRSGLFLHKL